MSMSPEAAKAAVLADLQSSPNWNVEHPDCVIGELVEAMIKRVFDQIKLADVTISSGSSAGTYPGAIK